MPKAEPRYEDVEVTGRDQWRAWLAANHAASPGVWLVTYKKTGGRPQLHVPYDDAVEEALCFGWVDSRPNKLDVDRSKLLVTPRKPGSPWSAPNKRRVAALLDAGLMTPAGLAKIEAAKRDGSWEALDTVEALEVPPDLGTALAANAAAETNFGAFPPSVKKPLLWWVASARRPETRAKRIARVVAEAAENRNPLAYRPKGEPGDA